MTADELVGLLAQPQRLRVVAALVLGARTPAELATMTGLDDRTIAKALHRLESGGLVSLAADGATLREQVFQQVARAGSVAAPVEDHGYADHRVETTLRTFLRDGHLVGLPAQLGRRRMVLEHIAQSFEPGTHYAEREVDAVLRAWCEGGRVDHVTLRRYLVDEHLLSRDGTDYWRSGGWLDVLGER